MPINFRMHWDEKVKTIGKRKLAVFEQIIS
jgi:hypothetical protein